MKTAYYIGIMSGTSLDGIDAVLADFNSASPSLLHTFYLSYRADLRERLLGLHYTGHDELHRAATLANELARQYAEAVTGLLGKSGVRPQEVAAIGCHGQTVRHFPQAGRGYTIQLCNSALLVELTGIAVVADFRSRDIAAGGQGAPLVPAFHQVLFSDPQIHRVIVNIGGICNLTSLAVGGEVIGFDCGPGNMMMDEWSLRHTGKEYDENGAWAESGEIIQTLLEKLLALPFFSLPPPKSAGREMFNLALLERYLTGDEKPVDVQATLLQLTVAGIAESVRAYFPGAAEVYLCGGGARNKALVGRLQAALPGKKVDLTDSLGINADWLEAFAFAWLAHQAIERRPGNIPDVTGARGPRLLGAIYPV
ncbi:anhydro-N-acetylmuramic acid kinase [Nitrosospira briensis]|uniref:Anhydro-N-acetylmuramic acid kinase n=1 Tax=Nitrosospira briensis TaxID=35799 RepID=A0A1I5AD27_9PROT|nr:anhydro-N-acetylmuramic acid kinase [Nitrosospira briensis]SFN60356.1 anhydro-N-acetylmuramic acid kinase [Nitrosospira briensis]